MNLRKFIIGSIICMALILTTTLSFAIPGQERMRPADEAKPWFVQGMNKPVATLKPGETAYCNKNFRVKNEGEELAQVQVIMGNGATYYWDRLEPNSSKGYTLGEISGYSSPGASAVDVDEARIINSTTGETSLKVLCE